MYYRKTNIKNLLEKPIPRTQRRKTYAKKPSPIKMGHFYILQERHKTNNKASLKKKLRIVFRTQNTINHILKHHLQTDKYNNSRIYQVKRLDCPLKYVGQTGRTFSFTYIHAIRSNNNNSGYSNYKLNTDMHMEQYQTSLTS
jgi:hypothetical protein